MTKISYGLKLKVVTAYLQGESSINLQRKFSISKFSVFNWVQRYKKYGSEGLKKRTDSHEYDGDFKLRVLKWKKSHQATYAKTADHFQISNPGTIANWQRRYDDVGWTGTGLFRKDVQQLVIDREKISELEHENELLRSEILSLRAIKLDSATIEF
ncbi:hypothetical protein FD33_GL001645 [Companilactobacillus paralimentarius DSM 13238 = JCM 10415]|uniref:Insertion element IS150 protein InsJ-like helix-turn-helix domain-containing protein n=1 Tax=Companilactobacillus paralimentarius DSM 13238 = JCM 10415 TaxID=1122151 RepID=A0A0R1PHJ0_9LACO|nr:helix-turn-helix domain-containing protein [Companilactobacillus paralimentarius]KAE9558264.1 hypothetical protein ATN96_01430 [Companilactobacillus paralimentarius]KRL28363.1 hypothetical protein FD33_GL001645 [Companilactobacillus paralimentarius DSM 13238 = JCM 10415]MDR4933094.1 helix-turn-helix domain-containing protein [Companilactobacillus paralimentarius]